MPSDPRNGIYAGLRAPGARAADQGPDGLGKELDANLACLCWPVFADQDVKLHSLVKFEPRRIQSACSGSRCNAMLDPVKCLKELVQRSPQRPWSTCLFKAFLLDWSFAACAWETWHEMVQLWKLILGAPRLPPVKANIPLALVIRACLRQLLTQPALHDLKLPTPWNREHAASAHASKR